MITEHTICALPEDHPDWRHFAIKVQRRRTGMWVLQWCGLYLSDGDNWLSGMGDAVEFVGAEALRVAEELAPRLSLDEGYTVARALERGRR